MDKDVCWQPGSTYKQGHTANIISTNRQVNRVIEKPALQLTMTPAQNAPPVVTAEKELIHTVYYKYLEDNARVK